MNEFCSNLDSYLLGDLSSADSAAFAEHLAGCEDCREAIEQQQWVDSMLQASSHLDTQVPPRHIASEFRVVAASRESFRKRVIAIALATAATLLVAATWLLAHSGNKSTNHVVTTIDASAAPLRQQATFVAGNDTIAVPVKSTHADVTIVRVYSAFQPTNDSKMTAFEPESTNLNNSMNFSNGG
ncbi:MAG TPA: zf-HC2 domain-containing protein [Lacipirellulaceae bacterium]|jgi:anti-sigma factor RsiW|nr:zf-HC2 domain-containing protein [Lacipirellulaceae bacterium]